LYRFAYTETLAKTETSLYGAQHPSYDIQISGSGDVVLTDIKEISASLRIGEDITGRLSIRDSSDFLVAELTKLNAKPIELGLESGLYHITLQQGDNFYRAEVFLTENSRVLLTLVDFTQIAAASGNRNRGTATDSPADEDVPVNILNFQFIPGMDITGHGGEKATNNFLLGPFMAMGHNLQGIGAAGIGLINSGWVQGVQGSGIFNIAEGDVQGVQGAGIFNIAHGRVEGVQGSGIFNYAEDDFLGIQGAGIFNYSGGSFQGAQGSGIFNYAGGNSRGLQGAGIFNYAGGSFQGVQASGILNYTEGYFKGLQAGLVNMAMGDGGSIAQAGIVNISKAENTVALGLVNVVKNGLMHPSIFYDDMGFVNAGFRSGSKHVYSLITLGAHEDTLLSSRMGMGLEYTIGKFFMDVDLSFGSIIDLDTVKEAWDSLGDENQIESASLNIAQLRFTAGYKIFEHLGVFAGVSYDYMYRHKDNSPDPGTFVPFMLGAGFGRGVHKLGFFGGVQF
jgi:hypothetical protein